ncbi:MAG: DUF2057 family protein [Psychromonas sp.]
MRYFMIVVITFFCFSASSQAATLSMGDGLRLLAIDGQVIVEKNTLPVEIKLGKRQVVISYEKMLSGNNRGNSGSYRNRKNTIVTSSPYIFFVDINQDTNISVKRYTSAFQARSAIQRGLVFNVENQQETKQIDNADMLKGNGVNPFSPTNLEPLIDTYNQENGINYE